MISGRAEKRGRTQDAQIWWKPKNVWGRPEGTRLCGKEQSKPQKGKVQGGFLQYTQKYLWAGTVVKKIEGEEKRGTGGRRETETEIQTRILGALQKGTNLLILT